MPQTCWRFWSNWGSGQAFIGGHSMGGLITLEMYREVPERFLVMRLLDTTTAVAPIAEQYL
jgi:pimeloyl-ACP methyl ester carboxylesterase